MGDVIYRPADFRVFVADDGSFIPAELHVPKGHAVCFYWSPNSSVESKLFLSNEDGAQLPGTFDGVCALELALC